MLKGKVAIITGASRGIGCTTALAFAQADAKVVLASRTQHDLETAANLIRAEGGEALVVPTDVTRADAVEALVNRTLGAYGQIDILVNNAGIGVFETVVDSDPGGVDSGRRLQSQQYLSLFKIRAALYAGTSIRSNHQRAVDRRKSCIPSLKCVLCSKGGRTRVHKGFGGGGAEREYPCHGGLPRIGRHAILG